MMIIHGIRSICSTWFLDIRISSCFILTFLAWYLYQKFWSHHHQEALSIQNNNTLQWGYHNKTFKRGCQFDFTFFNKAALALWWSFSTPGLDSNCYCLLISMVYLWFVLYLIQHYHTVCSLNPLNYMYKCKSYHIVGIFKGYLFLDISKQHSSFLNIFLFSAVLQK